MIMNNKKAKQMICDLLNKKHECYVPYFGFYFQSDGLYMAFHAGSGPDNYYDDCEKFEGGTVSIKGKV